MAEKPKSAGPKKPRTVSGQARRGSAIGDANKSRTVAPPKVDPYKASISTKGSATFSEVSKQPDSIRARGEKPPSFVNSGNTPKPSAVLDLKETPKASELSASRARSSTTSSIGQPNRAKAALSGISRVAGRVGRFIPGIGTAAGLTAGLGMLGDTLKDLREKEDARAKERKDAADSDQRKAASFPRGNPSGRKATETARTQEIVVPSTSPSKNTNKPSSGQKKAPTKDKPMTDEEILAWNNKRKAARGEKQLDKSVMDKASYKRGK